MASQEFGGFPPLTANFTPTPNVFFDYVLPNFPPCVVSVVGAIIRATLGWVDSVTGEKRAECELSIPDIARLSKMSENSVRKGVRQALEAGLIIETASAGMNTGARYALRWENEELQRQAIERSRRSTGDYPLPPVKSTPPSNIEGGSTSEGVQKLTPSKSAPLIKKRSLEKETVGLFSERNSLNVSEEGDPPAPQHPDARGERSTEENEIYKREVLGPVRDVISLTNDHHSWRRWVQLREIAIDSNIIPAWEQCMLSLQNRMLQPGLENPGAWLQSAMVKAFSLRGVTVPTGTPEERDEIRDAIAASLGLSGGKDSDS